MNVKLRLNANMCAKNKILASKTAKSKPRKDFRFSDSYLEKVYFPNISALRALRA